VEIKSMTSRIKGFLAVFLVLLIFLTILIGGIGYFYGVFSPVKITTGIRGPYLMVYMLHRGAYHQITGAIKKVGELLDEQKIPKTISCAIFYDDPRDVAMEDLKSEGGYLVDQRPLSSLKHPFGLREIPERGVILATTKAHPLLAPFKTYAKIVDFMQMHHLEHDGPAMERYLPGGIVEVEMPFQSPTLDQLRDSIKDMRFPARQAPGHQASTNQIPGHQDSTNLTDPAHTGPAHTGPTHTDPAHTSPTHTGPTHTGPTHTGPTHTGLAPANPTPTHQILTHEE
jgi:effector-binding domain-containing protein